MEACVVSRSHEYVSVENRTWDKRKRTLIKAWILLYVSAFLLGGILNVFQPYVRGGAVFLILAFAGYHLCLGIWDLLAYFHKNMAGACRARLYQNGRECEIYAIIDTGNRLRDSLTGRPVHVITGEIAEKLGCTDFSSKRNHLSEYWKGKWYDADPYAGLFVLSV